jgi:hypothetical protein
MRSRVKVPVNKLKSLCVEVYLVFDKRISKYIEVNHGGTYTYKIF